LLARFFLKLFWGANTLLAEEWDEGKIQTRYAVKVTRYINRFQSEGSRFGISPNHNFTFIAHFGII